jgi:hypothetical protein
MSADPQLRAMPFSIAGLCAALRSLCLKSASFDGSARGSRLPTPVLQAAAVGICLVALKIRRKPLPAKAALSLKSP